MICIMVTRDRSLRQENAASKQYGNNWTTNYFLSTETVNSNVSENLNKKSLISFQRTETHLLLIFDDI